MPLIYQGSLNKKTTAKASTALRFGTQRMGALQHSRVDMRISWPGPEVFGAVDELLSAGQAPIFWFDVAAHADPYVLQQVPQWLGQLSGGHISLLCLKDGYESEVRISLQGCPPERLDHQYFEGRFAQHWKQTTVRTSFLSSPKHMTDTQKAYGRSRVRDAFQRLCERTIDAPPRLESWLNAHRAQHGRALEDEAFEAEELTAIEHVLPMSNDTKLDWASMDVQPSFLGDDVTDLQVRVDGERFEWCCALWTELCSALPQVDAVLLRTAGTRAAIIQVLDHLDLYPFHPVKQANTFGVHTALSKARLPQQKLESVVTDPRTTHQCLDWGLRWSGLKLELDGLEKTSISDDPSYYVIRSDGTKSIDRLFLSIDLEDPLSPFFRAARRQLGEHFGDMMGRETAWEYMGPSVESPVGRQYQALTRSLALIAQDTRNNSPALDPSKHQSWLARLPFLRGKKDPEHQFIERVLELTNNAIPGFQFDRRAHITDQYFVEFIRRIQGGYQILQLVRRSQPSGFRLRVGIAKYRIAFEDLSPGQNSTVPGYIAEPEVLYPERADGWRYRSSREFDAALDDFKLVLETRVRPFLESATRRLEADEFRPSGVK
ncbi:MAG: hypothetical protein ACON3Z_13910 [Bradymonadia bacterium]